MGGLRAIYIATFSQAWPKADAAFGMDPSPETQLGNIWFDSGIYGYWGIVVDAGTFDSGDIINAVDQLPGGPLAKFYSIDVSRGGAEINSTLELNEENNSSSVETVITIPVARLSQQAVSVINTLLNTQCFVVAETHSGHLIPVGLDNPAKISAASLETGANAGARAGETFQIRSIGTRFPAVTLAEFNHQVSDDPDGRVLTPSDFRNLFVRG